jgi:hypothetical protein
MTSIDLKTVLLSVSRAGHVIDDSIHPDGSNAFSPRTQLPRPLRALLG